MTFSRSTLAALLSVLLAVGSGCTRKPKAPSKKETAPPPPEFPHSTATVPIRISLSSLAEGVDAEVPRKLKREKIQKGPIGVHYTIERGTITLAGNPEGMRIQVPLTLKANAILPEAQAGGAGRLAGLLRRYTTGQLGCKSTLEVAFLSRLRLDADWQLQSTTEPLEHKWVAPCKISFAKIDITQTIDKPLQEQLAKVSATIDRKIQENGDLKPRVEEIWRTLSAPIDVGGSRWLAFNPERMRIGAIRGEAETLEVQVGLVARPQLVTARAKPEVAALPGNQGEMPPEGFEIALAAPIRFEDATAQLRDRLADMRFNAPGGQSIGLTNGRVSGRNGRLMIDLDLTGAVQGKMTLTGVPKYDAEAGEVYIDDLDYDLATRNYLARAASWAFESQIQKAIAGKARFPLKNEFEKARSELNQQLNRALAGSAELQGKVEEVKLGNVFVGDDALIAMVLASGHLVLSIN